MGQGRKPFQAQTYKRSCETLKPIWTNTTQGIKAFPGTKVKKAAAKHANTLAYLSYSQIWDKVDFPSANCKKQLQNTLAYLFRDSETKTKSFRKIVIRAGCCW